MAGLLRYQLFLSIFILFLSLWKTSLTNASTIQRYSPFPSSTTEVIITYLPLWALICLGMYALSCVLYKVVTFEDCAGASLELGREIEIAKEKLKSRGFEFWKNGVYIDHAMVTERAFLPDFLRCKIQCVLPSRTMGGLFVIVQSENEIYLDDKYYIAKLMGLWETRQSNIKQHIIGPACVPVFSAKFTKQ